jgi:hypothetical protein
MAYRIQVKQKDKVGRPDVASFEAMMREDCEKGWRSGVSAERHHLKISGRICGGLPTRRYDGCPQRLPQRGVHNEKAGTRNRSGSFFKNVLWFERKYLFPVVLHADDDPAILLRLVIKFLRKGADF